MVDLHIHTTFSDGSYTVLELLELLNRKDITIASFTDHNCVEAHEFLKHFPYSSFYHGKIINGVELQTTFNHFLVEVLVYEYDLTSFASFVSVLNEKFWQYHRDSYAHLLRVAKKIGLIIQDNGKTIQNGYYSNMKFQDEMKASYEKNKGIVDDAILFDHLYFYRHEFQNPDSPFYCDFTKGFFPIEIVIDAAHDCGGKVFLAHINEYRAIQDKMRFLNALRKTRIDGLECYHPSIGDESKIYRQICKENNWLISGGSDLHGPHLSHRMKIGSSTPLDDIKWIK